MHFPKILYALTFGFFFKARSTVMEVHKVNIAIVITANASTDMVPPDMVIVIKGQITTEKNFAGQNGKNKIVKKSAIFLLEINTQSSIQILDFITFSKLENVFDHAIFPSILWPNLV